jgi:hypothetical protein
MKLKKKTNIILINKKIKRPNLLDEEDPELLGLYKKPTRDGLE